MYLHNCERFAKHLVHFFFCNDIFLLLSDAVFLVNSSLLSLVPSSVSCMEKRAWASSHSSICPKSTGMHGKIPGGFSELWIGH